MYVYSRERLQHNIDLIFVVISFVCVEIYEGNRRRCLFWSLLLLLRAPVVRVSCFAFTRDGPRFKINSKLKF